MRPIPSTGVYLALVATNSDHHEAQTWRMIYWIDLDVILVLEIFSKKTPTTSKTVIENCQRRLAWYDAAQRKAQQTGGDEWMM